jgi:N-acetyltransferase
MGTEEFVLHGKTVRLEPLEPRHVDGLEVAAAGDPSLYRWSPVPHGKAEAISYVDTALSWRDAGTAVPFAIVRIADGIIIGSTRFWNLERWAWPKGHPSHGHGVPDACEIGYTWLAHSAIRTGANTEAKLLMLTHAFESWRVLRVCFHTDVRNLRFAGCSGAYRLQVRRDSPRSSHGCRFPSARFGTLFDRRFRMAGCSEKADWLTQSHMNDAAELRSGGTDERPVAT